MIDKLICKLCSRDFKNYKGITSHIRQTHKINPKEYYDLYLKKNNEEICNNPNCYNICGYQNFNYGYYSYCSHKCKNNSPEMRKIISESALKYLSVPKNKEKLKNRVKKQWKENKKFIEKMTTSGVKWRIKQGKTLTERYKDPKERKKTSESIKKAYKENPKLKEQASQHALKMWRDPDGPFSKQSYWNNLSASLSKTGMNDCEKIVYNLIEELFPGEYRYTGDYNFWIHGRNPDFLCYKNKKIIEHFGVWWHGEKVTGQSREDHEKERIKHFEKYGYECLVIWEDDIKSGKNLTQIKNSLLDIKNKIINFHKE